MAASKASSLFFLLFAELAGLSLWFTSAAVLPEMMREAAIPTVRQALLSSGVQAGFVVGALFFSISGIPDRYDPRRVLALSAVLASAFNLSLVVLPPGGDAAILARVATGALLAGVYPVGMKIAVGWGTKDRGFIVGLFIGALVFGNSIPFLAAFLGGPHWRATVAAVSAVACLGGFAVLAAGLGPHHARSLRFEPRAIRLAWTDRRIRAAYLGYLGHMWELYVMWAWAGVATLASYSRAMAPDQAARLAALTAFLGIAVGAVTCIAAGAVADRIGKAEVAVAAMAVSGLCAVLTAVTFGGPVWITFAVVLVWGISVAPDSGQFSALVADYAPPQSVGSLLAFQTALGFALTAVTVQLAPLAAGLFGWPVVLAATALGPAVGILAMLPLRRSARRS
ncbi:MFS transporter [Microbaculum marinum]|uniref:MFS transporter n=1 Tax=Microbaculum marinum TaxID=1764581 RepID=A0AAW9RYI9_9HYPH